MKKLAHRRGLRPASVARRVLRPAFALVAALPLLAGAGSPEYRVRRPIDAAPGWNRLELPNDVLDAARPGLSDLRIRTDRGDDVPYALDGAAPPRSARLAVVDVETTPNQETTALVDRGQNPGLADAVELEVGETEFIKPVVIEASPDRAAWSEVAHGSIFSTSGGASSRRIRFAPNDRRYWRFRFDDRNGPAIRPLGASASRATEHKAPERVDLAVKLGADAEPTVSTYAVALPAANLAVSEIGVEVSDPAFSRAVRVFERVSFRDEASRRLLGEGEIVRAADGRSKTSVVVAEPTGKNLEIDVERTSSAPLQVTAAWARFERHSLVFHAQDAPLELFYGSRGAERPAYDVGAALATGRPSAFAAAKLGAPLDAGTDVPAVPSPTRGAPLDLAAWSRRRPIVLPAIGPVAYLDLDHAGDSLADVRIVDASSQQVPYLVEAGLRHVRTAATWRAERVPRKTLVYLTGLDPTSHLTALEIEATSPEYFSREFRVIEPIIDRRGPAGERTLGSGRLVKTEETRRVPLRVEIAEPTGTAVTLEIGDGDNAPIEVAAVSLDLTRRRVNFVFLPGERLTLVSGNTAAAPPHYDLALVATRVLSSPAEAASLAPAEPSPPPPAKVPRWFWLFVLAAAGLLFVALARTLKGEPDRPA